VIAAASVGLLVLLAAAGGIGWKLSRGGGSHTAVLSATPPPTHPATPSTSAPASATAVTSSSTPTTPTDFAAIYARASSGVVRIETVGCSEDGVGTGFLLSPTLVATVNHVVADSTVVSLIDGTQRTTGTVIGTDPSTDLALVRANHPLAGYHFTLATTAPAVGTRVAAIGFPIADPITLTVGDISGLDRNIPVNGRVLTGLIETDTPINPGNSGGPLLTFDGTVVGLIDATRTDATAIGYAIPATAATTRFQQWKANPTAQPPASCSNPLGPQQQASPDLPGTLGTLTNAQSDGIAAALSTYFNGINTGNYSAAWAVLSPRLQATTSFPSFQTGTSTSFDSGFTILNTQATSPSHALIDLGFNSLQAASSGPNGETCDNWTLEYTFMKSTDGSWLIDATDPYNGKTNTPC
jgi:S1-C subfamily serine protease